MGLLKQGKYFVIFESISENLERVESLTSQIATEIGFNDSAIDDLSIAITELFNNAIHHGNKKDAAKKISVQYKFINGKLVVSVRDEGEGFKPDKIKNPLDPENLMAESGRGIYLVKMLMDKVEFRINQKGSEIKITKELK
jgi:serine/threonine-protein kinase RsbW